MLNLRNLKFGSHDPFTLFHDLLRKLFANIQNDDDQPQQYEASKWAKSPADAEQIGMADVMIEPVFGRFFLHSCFEDSLF